MEKVPRKYPMAEAIRMAYRAGEDEESLEPRVLFSQSGKPIGRFSDGDYVIFYNLRGEREVELCQSLLHKDFAHFAVAANIRLNLVTMIPYDRGFRVKVAFSQEEEIRNTLSEVLSRHGLRQAKISESEKAVHVSYFLNGKIREPFPGEERIVVPTPKDVPFFDQKPEMNAAGVADEVIQKLGEQGLPFIFANFANIDVVGHIEIEGAVIKAIEAVDRELGRCLKAAREAGVLSLVTADHGTAEKWYYPDGTIDTGHTDSPVPLVFVDPDPDSRFSWALNGRGELTDLAPTVLQILALPQTEAMTGKSLLVHPPPQKEKRILLILLDGWGYRAERQGNLIARAHTPVMEAIESLYPFAILDAAGEAVGLPQGAVGNSEAGHLHIGAGRKIYSDRLRIDRAIEDGSFFQNEALLWAMEEAKREGKRLHLLGIVSFFSSHGSLSHLKALLELAKRKSLSPVYLHAMLGRRGEYKESGARYIEEIEREMTENGLGQVVSAIGRYWSLDREENWDRIEKTYRMLLYGEGQLVRG